MDARASSLVYLPAPLSRSRPNRLGCFFTVSADSVLILPDDCRPQVGSLTARPGDLAGKLECERDPALQRVGAERVQWTLSVCEGGV